LEEIYFLLASRFLFFFKKRDFFVLNFGFYFVLNTMSSSSVTPSGSPNKSVSSLIWENEAKMCEKGSSVGFGTSNEAIFALG
jgi:hypothetical protein